MIWLRFSRFCRMALFPPSKPSISLSAMSRETENAILVSITWKTCKLQSFASSISGNRANTGGWFGCHSILEMTFSDGSTWHTEKYPQKSWMGSDVEIAFTPGVANGDVFKGPVSGENIQQQGWLWKSPIKGSDILNFTASTDHPYRYCSQESNCHHYAQDVWNFCVRFNQQVWWRPDMLKAQFFGGGIFGTRVGVDFDEPAFAWQGSHRWHSKFIRDMRAFRSVIKKQKSARVQPLWSNAAGWIVIPQNFELNSSWFTIKYWAGLLMAQCPILLVMVVYCLVIFGCCLPWAPENQLLVVN